jgi:hypothetical protein
MHIFCLDALKGKAFRSGFYYHQVVNCPDRKVGKCFNGNKPTIKGEGPAARNLNIGEPSIRRSLVTILQRQRLLPPTATAYLEEGRAATSPGLFQ